MQRKERAVLVPRAFTPRFPSSKYLWHMFRWNQLGKLRTFIEGGLWMSRLDQFKCALEGTLPDKNLGLLDMLLTPEMAEYTKEQYQLAKMRGYASCWHMSDGEPNEKMWKSKFGNNFKGIALRTTPDALRSQLIRLMRDAGPCYLSEVKYIDHKSALVPEANTLDVAFCVRNEFRYQREARVYIQCYGAPAARVLAAEPSMWGTPLVRRVPPGQSFSKEQELGGFVPAKATPEARKHNWEAIVPRIKPEELIEEILVGPKVNDEEYAFLMGMLAGSALEGRTRRAARKTILDLCK